MIQKIKSTELDKNKVDKYKCKKIENFIISDSDELENNNIHGLR